MAQGPSFYANKVGPVPTMPDWLKYLMPEPPEAPTPPGPPPMFQRRPPATEDVSNVRIPPPAAQAPESMGVSPQDAGPEIFSGAALQGLLGSQGLPPAQDHGARAQVEGLQREMQRNLAKQARFPTSYASGATNVDVSHLSDILNTNPDFGTDALARDRGVEEQYRGAVSKGFTGTNPVAEQARYGRGLAEEELRQPMAIAQENQRGNLAQEQARAKGLIDVERERQIGEASRAESYADLQKYLYGEGGGMGNVTGMTLPGRTGGGSIRFQPEQRVPTQSTQSVTALRRAYEENPNATNKVAMDQAINNVIGFAPASDAVKQITMQVLGDTAYDQATVDQIIDVSDMEPQEAAEFRDLMLQIGRR